MKLLTFRSSGRETQAGVLQGKQVIPLPYATLLELLHDPQGLSAASDALKGALVTAGHPQPLSNLTLLAPVPEPPTLRDFYAFEQHVKAARATRNLEISPEWYEIPTFYFSNTSEIYGTGQDVPYPEGSEELDLELEIACVIGRPGKNIPVEEAADYIAGYTIMNDWSARDFQRKDMMLNLGPGKGKDFATSLGPFLVTPDELVSHRTGSGASERYDLTMLARVNGQEISRGNFKDIYYSFPQMIAWASRNARLRPGDVLGSGTVGTGCLLEIGTGVHPWFRKGDLLELEIEGLGILRNRVV